VVTYSQKCIFAQARNVGRKQGSPIDRPRLGDGRFGTAQPNKQAEPGIEDQHIFRGKLFLLPAGNKTISNPKLHRHRFFSGRFK